MRELKGKTAVITGGASGIGLGIARALGGVGMRLVLADVDRDAADAALSALRAHGAEVLFIATDVANPAAVEVLARRTFREMGGCHVLCNNAGVGKESSVAAGSDDD